jgi:hypothetical protein
MLAEAHLTLTAGDYAASYVIVLSGVSLNPFCGIVLSVMAYGSPGYLFFVTVMVV